MMLSGGISRRRFLFGAAGVVAIAILGWLLSLRPPAIDVTAPDFASRWLTTAIKQSIGNEYHIEIGGSRVELGLKTTATLHLQDILVRNPSGGIIAKVPAAGLTLSIPSLLMGRVLIERVTLADIQLLSLGTVMSSGDQNSDLRTGFEISTAIYAWVEGIRRGPAPPDIFVSNGRIAVDDALGQPKVSIENIGLSIASDTNAELADRASSDKPQRILASGLWRTAIGPISMSLSSRISGGEKTPPISVSADLTAAKVEDLLPDWIRPPGTITRASFVLAPQLQEIRLGEVVIEGNGVLAKGTVIIDANGSIVSSEFPVLSLAEAQTATLSSERTADGVSSVTVRAAAYDGRRLIRSFLGGAATQNPSAWSGDFDLDLMIGSVSGFGDETLRSLNFKASHRSGRLSNLAFNAKQGDDAQMIGRLQAFKDRPDAIRIEANDAGALLRFGDLYSRMSGGRLFLTIAPPASGQRSQEGTLDIRNFTVRDEPALMGFTGIARETPTTFNSLRLDFVRTTGVVAIRNGSMIGPQLGATLDGAVDLIRSEVRLSGAFIPRTALNNLMGQLPILGSLLGGGSNDNPGPGARFEVTGSSSAPTLAINPLSAMSPGTLRKIFQTPSEPATVLGVAGTIDRYPTIKSPDRVTAGMTATVLVSLTVDKITPEVTVTSAGDTIATTPQGALSIPAPSDAARLTVNVVLRAPGFDLDPSTSEEATITLSRNRDSTSARFRITARSDAAGVRALRVTLWRDNEFLAQVSRKIEIVVRADASASVASSALLVAPAAAPNRSADGLASAPGRQTQFATTAGSSRIQRFSTDNQLAVAARPRPVDLKVEVTYDDPRSPGRGRVTIASDYLGNMRHGEVNTPPDLVSWLEGFYRNFRILGGRGVRLAEPAHAAGREAQLGRLRAFGEELYRRAAPQELKTALTELLANPAVELRTVQIYSNNPQIPWELMRAPIAGGGTTDFFGIAFALARWHEDDGPRPVLRPPQDQQVDEVVTIAPSYSGAQALIAPSREIEEIRGLLTTRPVLGSRAEFSALVRNPPRGIIHFAGHGEVAGATAVERRFSIRLEDGSFDVMDWRGVAVSQSRERALIFFNACDIGQAESIAGVVEGWAPAILARGAAGFIGGLWPLKDDPAGRFAVAFYRAASKRLAAHGRASVAEALSDARRLVYETADPTYLAYAFYGDAQLALVRH